VDSPEKLIPQEDKHDVSNSILNQLNKLNVNETQISFFTKSS